jgi:hypothetical protein
MPNQKQRKKKGTVNKSKKRHAMREAVAQRKAGRETIPNRRDKRQPGALEFKPDGADKGVGGRAR